MKFSHFIVILVSISCALFIADFVLENQKNNTSNLSGSILSLENNNTNNENKKNRESNSSENQNEVSVDISDTNTDKEKELDLFLNQGNIKTEVNNNNFSLNNTVNKEVLDDNSVISLEIQKSASDLTHKDIFTENNLKKAGLNNASLISLKYTNKLFDYFAITELANSPLTKKAIYSNNDIIAYIYEFPNESYALGLDYQSVKNQIQNQISSNYKINEPSSFGKNSLYITSNDENNKKITSVAEINGTLIGLEYTKETYPIVQKVIDVILAQN